MEQQESYSIEDTQIIPYQHEDIETATLRMTYEESLRETEPSLDEETVTIIAQMVIKKARYGVVYENQVEDLIREINEKIKKNYS